MITKNWSFIGDVNPLDHGGMWIKQTGYTNYDMVQVVPTEEGYTEIHDMYVEITDEWLDFPAVAAYGDYKTSDPIEHFIASAVSYHGQVNFGSTAPIIIRNVDSENENMITELLAQRGIYL